MGANWLLFAQGGPMSRGIIVSPSILSANFAKLGEDIQKIESSGADSVHIDVMDGAFVPNISFGAKVVADIRPLTKLFFDVHLMIENPGDRFEDFVQAGAQSITFHWEAARHHHRLLQNLDTLGVEKGISLVPSTPVSVLDEILPYLDLVLIMTVNPGFGGQKMIPGCVDKVKQLKEIRDKRGLDYQIQVDGGVNSSTYLELVQAGADNLVAGSAFFGAPDPQSLVQAFKS
jgi:ribulose-phosphate 3-epimerase